MPKTHEHEHKHTPNATNRMIWNYRRQWKPSCIIFFNLFVWSEGGNPWNGYTRCQTKTNSKSISFLNRKMENMKSSLHVNVRDEYTSYVSTIAKPQPQLQPQPQPQPQLQPQSKQMVGGTYVLEDTWKECNGKEFEDYENVKHLCCSGLNVCEQSNLSEIEWKPDKKTQAILQEHGDIDSPSLKYALEHILPRDTILVWTGKLKSHLNAYGSSLPFIRTRGIISGLSPHDVGSLLMDSTKVKLYNAMSLGREDLVVYQKDINTIDGSFGNGESKIVRNLTQPPLVNKPMEFNTFMHAQKLKNDDQGYIVVSRAVATKNKDSNTLESEILMGANLLRSVEGQPKSTDLTSVTHVNSPMVHPMVAGKVGITGAINFFNDVRALGN